MLEFFSFHITLREYFFVLRPPPPHSNKFSNGPSQSEFAVRSTYVRRMSSELRKELSRDKQGEINTPDTL